MQIYDPPMPRRRKYDKPPSRGPAPVTPRDDPADGTDNDPEFPRKAEQQQTWWDQKNYELQQQMNDPDWWDELNDMLMQMLPSLPGNREYDPWTDGDWDSYIGKEGPGGPRTTPRSVHDPDWGEYDPYWDGPRGPGSPPDSREGMNASIMDMLPGLLQTPGFKVGLAGSAGALGALLWYLGDAALEEVTP